jgi:hypothetical protein
MSTLAIAVICLFVGGTIGFIAAALCCAAGKADE